MTHLTPDSQHILICTVPAYGHSYQIAFLARDLIAQGYRITIATTEKFESLFTPCASVEILYYPSTISFPDTFSSNGLAILREFNALTRAFKHTSWGDTVNPDYVLYDIHAQWGRVYADKKNIRSYSYDVTFMYDTVSLLYAFWKFPSFRKNIFASFLLGYQLRNEGSIFQKQIKGTEHFLLGPSSLFLIRHTQSIGPIGLDFKNTSLTELSKTNTIYVSLGTVYVHQETLRTIMKGIEEYLIENNDTQTQIVVSAGIYAEQLARDFVHDVRYTIHQHINQRAALAKSFLFITHAGPNSVWESISARVPMLAIPQAHDQFPTAAWITNHGIGLALDPSHLTTERITASIHRIKKNQKHHLSRLDILADTMSTYAGTSALLPYITKNQ